MFYVLLVNQTALIGCLVNPIIIKLHFSQILLTIKSDEHSDYIDSLLKVWQSVHKRLLQFEQAVYLMRLCHPPDGSTSPKYKLLCFITTKLFLQREERTSF